MTEEKKKAQYSKPASQVDLEERQATGNRSNKILSTSDEYEPDEEDKGRSFAVKGNDTEGYVGVDPEYQTYANETESPRSPGGAEKKVVEAFTGKKVKAKKSASSSSESTSGDDKS